MAKVITVASGKGGVGKTSISLNLSLSLASAGYRVCLFDADLGLANVNILTGLYPQHGLGEVIFGKFTLDDILLKDFKGIDIIPGSSGVEKLADLSSKASRRLISSFLSLPDYDYFILDTSAGISSQVLSFCRASHEMILVATPEPTSLTDAYSLLKVLSKKRFTPKVRVVINQVSTASTAKKAYAKLKETVDKFLPIKISPLGVVARDKNVPIAIASQTPFTLLFPDSDASRCVKTLAMKLAKERDLQADMPIELFWDNCLNLLSQDRPEKLETSPLTGQGTGGKGVIPVQSPQKKDEKPIFSGKAIEKDLGELKSRLAGLEGNMSRVLGEMAEIKALIMDFDPPGKKIVSGKVDARTQTRIKKGMVVAQASPDQSKPDEKLPPEIKPVKKAKKQTSPRETELIISTPQERKRAVPLDFEAWMAQQSSRG